LKDQPPSFDPLAMTLAEAHKRGLKVHAWLNTSLLANLDALPSDPLHVYNKHPEWLAVPKPVAGELYKLSPRDPAYRQKIVEWSRANRGELEGVYTGPANPKVREHIYKIWMDVLKHYPVDGLHFDYVRFASPDFDYSRTSLEKFREWLKPQLNSDERARLKTALRSNSLAAPELFPARFADFQRAQVTMLVERIYRAVKKEKPGVLVSAAVFANDENAGCRWEFSMSPARWRTQPTPRSFKNRLKSQRRLHTTRSVRCGRESVHTGYRLTRRLRKLTSPES
jgi:uncharacterized lipoprotein YddW (UPF0748 family)